MKNAMAATKRKLANIAVSPRRGSHERRYASIATLRFRSSPLAGAKSQSQSGRFCDTTALGHEFCRRVAHSHQLEFSIPARRVSSERWHYFTVEVISSRANAEPLVFGC